MDTKLNRCCMPVVFVLLVGLATRFASAEKNAPPPEPFGDVLKDSPGRWVFREDFSDEFNTDHIDRAKWNFDTKDFGPWSWQPDNVAQKNGAMHLQMVRKDHQRGRQALHYTSGMARIDRPVTYGYFEARVRGCSRYPGACPAFWLYSIGPQNRFQARDGETVAYSEIDIVELQQSEFDFETKQHFPVTRIDCNLHATLIQDGKRVWVRPHSHPELCRNHFDSPWDPRETITSMESGIQRTGSCGTSTERKSRENQTCTGTFRCT